MDQPECLDDYDRVMESTIRRLVPGCSEDSIEQAALSLKVGGLGTRKAKDVALASCISSRAIARAKVCSVGEDLATAGLLQRGMLVAEHDRVQADCVQAFKADL